MQDAADEVPVTVPDALAILALPISTPFTHTTAPSMALSVIDAFKTPVEGNSVVNCCKEKTNSAAECSRGF
jgi:hypothetical protein